MLRLTALTLCTVLALGACSPKDSDSAPQAKEQAVSAAQSESASVTVKTARGDVQIPQNPERIAVYDLGMLDTLSKLGVKTGLSVDKTCRHAVRAGLRNAQCLQAAAHHHRQPRSQGV